ncbi:MAG: hypothetical protein LBM93_09565 [Oscillospiraceae bacterium]|jgi:hypothetical protein|nr:hypothetical protein [Oscillospiraceae bacterium]
MYDEIKSYCPLVDKEVSEGECYDVQMVRSGFIKSSILDFELNTKRAEFFCSFCRFNQLECEPPLAVQRVGSISDNVGEI